MAAGDPAAPLPLQGIVPHAYSSPPRILTEVGCRGDIPALRLASSVSFFQSELHRKTRERKKGRHVKFVAPLFSLFAQLQVINPWQKW